MKTFKIIGRALLGLITLYAIFSFCQWNPNPGEWGGFWRFIFGFFSAITIAWAADN